MALTLTGRAAEHSPIRSKFAMRVLREAPLHSNASVTVMSHLANQLSCCSQSRNPSAYHNYFHVLCSV